MRLDKYLTKKYPNLSRVYIKDQIKLGNFLVYPVRSQPENYNIPEKKPKAKSQNKLDTEIKHGWDSNGVEGKIVKPFYLLRESDLVVFAPGFTLPESARLLPNPNIKLDIIYEDDNVIVINKPAGLSVHPRQDKAGRPLLSEVNTTLVSGLLAYYPAIANVGDSITSPYPSPSKGEGTEFASIPSPPFEGGEKEGVTSPLLRPGLVHRLDKDTSGVMIIAKNQTSFEWLKAQFKERQTAKKYLALAHGSLKAKQGEIKTLLARAKENPTKQKVLPRINADLKTPLIDAETKTKGKEAITEYKVLKEFKDYTLLEASPKTGRLHQIRVHLAHIGHPIAGDAKYGAKLLPSPPGLTRQFLHAQELEITLPDGQEKTFLAPLPAELQTVLGALENK